ncbi:hypothetical protein CH267_00460 [Rhodococcus sp. 06-621-2]|nr:carboxylesterase family protein [Rhodococcus sp. 06-621-2]OZC62857.1 hypothetical protein CH267_00460 [Rhodococcus sp. 06-621-2]
MREPNDSTSVLKVSQGRLAGYSAGGTHFFGGVPYAAPPLGDRRFLPPLAPHLWEGTRPAREPGLAAPQEACFAAVGEVYLSPLSRSEDCLTLTVRTPSLGASKLPVLVWLHGGGFAMGSGGDPVYQGGALSRDGVVHVSINYRLGALGFAAVDDSQHGITANAGLYDVIAALNWVRDEIAVFGGDPDNITLAGHSAGAMMVACLLGSPLGRGLFHKAIIQSAGAPLAIPADIALSVTRELADRAGTTTNSLAALQHVPLQSILQAQLDLSAEAYTGGRREQFGGASMAFNPVTGTAILPDEPLDAIAGGSGGGIPLLIGTTGDEAMLHLETVVAATETQPADARTVLNSVLARFGEQAPEIGSRYRTQFPELDDGRLAARVLGDAAFTTPTRTIAAAAVPHSAVHVYRFDEPTVRNGRSIGALHGAELPYLFGTADTAAGRHLCGEVDTSLARSMRTAWLTFAETGSPQWPGIAWPKYHTDEPVLLGLSAQGGQRIAVDLP